MNQNLSERIEEYPELKKHIEAMLDVVEDVKGTLKRADDAEIQVVDNMRKIGAAALHEWAEKQEKSTVTQWNQEHPKAKKHGKKNSIGPQALEDKN